MYTGRMRIGIVGLSRGLYMAELAHRIGIEVIAVCDPDSERMAAARAEFPDARSTEDWAELLDAGLDGVVLANDFDAHAELAIAFLDRGIHVLSETAACASEEEDDGSSPRPSDPRQPIRSRRTTSFIRTRGCSGSRWIRVSWAQSRWWKPTICTVCRLETRPLSSVIQRTGVVASRRPPTARTPSHRCSTSPERGQWRSVLSLWFG